MGSVIKALILSSDERAPYSVPDPKERNNEALRIKVFWKVFFFYDVDTLLIPKGPFGKYEIEFSPENRESILVRPEPDALFSFEELHQETRRRFPSFSHGFFLEYHLFIKGTDSDKAIPAPPIAPKEVKGFRLE